LGILNALTIFLPLIVPEPVPIGVIQHTNPRDTLLIIQRRESQLRSKLGEERKALESSKKHFQTKLPPSQPVSSIPGIPVTPIPSRQIIGRSFLPLQSPIPATLPPQYIPPSTLHKELSRPVRTISERKLSFPVTTVPAGFAYPPIERREKKYGTI